MRIAAMGLVLAGSTAMADEVISTFGHDWFVTLGWPVVAQTFTVPESNVLESFAITLKGTSEQEVLVLVYVDEWDAEAGDWEGTSNWAGGVWVQGTDVELVVFDDIGLALERGEEYAFIVSMHPEDGAGIPGVGYVQDAYDGGTLVTRVAFDEPVVWPAFDMLFSAEFHSCPADVNGDGALDIFDFIAFQGLYTAGDMEADCNGDGMLNVLDFVCFQSKFVGGC